MDTGHIVHQRATEELARLIAQQRLVNSLCRGCGKIGTIYGDDHVTLYCGRCYLIAHGVTPND